MVRNNASKLTKILNTAWLLFCLPLSTHSLAEGWEHNWQEAAQVNVVPVSYTHLTLPTKRIV